MDRALGPLALFGRRAPVTLEIGFGNGQPAAVAGLILFLGSRGKAVGEESIRKAVALWEKMKERHWFLTDRDDLPMAALLTSSSWDVETIDERVEAIWQALLRAKRSRGNALQFTSHVLTLSRLDEDVIVAKLRNPTHDIAVAAAPSAPAATGGTTGAVPAVQTAQASPQVTPQVVPQGSPAAGSSDAQAATPSTIAQAATGPTRDRNTVASPQ